MTSLSTPGARTLAGHPPFRLYLCARTLSEFAYQIAVVAVGWQVYAQTNSAFALGMVGLAQFLPSALLVFVGGHLADRHDRRRIVQICEIIQGLVAVFLAIGSFGGWLDVTEIFIAVAILGAAAAFLNPALSALLPGVTPPGFLQKASALSIAAMEVAIIGGPALGGFAYAVSPGVPYTAMAVLWLIAALLVGAISIERPIAPAEPPIKGALFAGIGFIRSQPAILGTISLDLFAVLLGGATALMPIFARDILHTGPWGLGVLRSAPAVGALLITFVLARHAISRRVGMRMFQSVIIFGAATLVFALSHWMWLSLLALVVMGAADTVSMVIRGTLIQVATPDHMRGRVGAVKSLFIDASNQLGEFESGVTAALFGAVPAAVLGGIGTIAVALAWMKLFPTLRDLEKLE